LALHLNQIWGMDFVAHNMIEGACHLDQGIFNQLSEAEWAVDPTKVR